jgi:hypothetical protein
MSLFPKLPPPSHIRLGTLIAKNGVRVDYTPRTSTVNMTTPDFVFTERISTTTAPQFDVTVQRVPATHIVGRNVQTFSAYFRAGITAGDLVYYKLNNFGEVFNVLLQASLAGSVWEESFLVSGVVLIQPGAAPPDGSIQKTIQAELEWPAKAGVANLQVSNHLASTRPELDGYMLAVECERIVGSQEKNIFGLSPFCRPITSILHPDRVDDTSVDDEMEEYMLGKIQEDD